MDMLQLPITFRQAHLLREILKRVSALDDRVLAREHYVSPEVVREHCLSLCGAIDDAIELSYRGHDAVPER